MIDVHAHFVAPTLRRFVEVEGDRLGVRVEPAGDSFRFRFAGGAVSRPFDPRMLDLQQRRAWLQERGLHRQILSQWVDTFGYGLPAEAGEAWIRRVNAEAAAAVGGDPAFPLLASLPIQDGAAAAREVERCAAAGGFCGFYCGTNAAGRGLADPGLEPLWAALQATGLPLMLHPVTVVASPRLQPFYLSNLIGNPLDTYIAAAELIFGGVLDRYPGLTVVLLHGGGLLPYGVGRLDHGRHVRPECRTPQQLPSDYLRRFYYDSVLHSVAALRFLRELVGSDRLLLGTDYPFDMADDHPVPFVRAALGATAADLDAAAAALFKL